MIDTLRWVTCAFEEVPEHDEWLGSEERATLAKLRFAKRRHDWRLGRWTAKRAVREALGADGPARPAPAMDRIQIIAAADGAPEPWLTPRRHVALSLSHSGERGFAAATPESLALGCDVERIEPHSESFIADYFAPEELPGFTHLSHIFHRDLAATLIWSAKESALKTLRTGLRDDTRSVLVDVDPSGELLALSAQGELNGWWWIEDDFVHTILVLQAGA